MENPQQSGWLIGRTKRHLAVLMHLAWPAAFSRMGMIVMTAVDMVIVGQYSTRELAYLSLGNGTFMLVMLVMALGLLLGTLVFTAQAHGRGDFEACGQVWRRSLPFAFITGLVSFLLLSPGELIFQAAGQTPELSEHGGQVMVILGLGLPGFLVFIAGIFFLEGIERPRPAMVLMLLVNLLNVGLDYILVFGAFDLPAMGAEGSAWATTILRTLMAVAISSYILLHPDFQKYGVRLRPGGRWRDWRDQRRMGYASSISLGAEVSAFAALSIFAGWIGALELAAFGVILNIISLPFTFAMGLGSATSVRVGIARSLGDRADMKLAGWTALGLSSLAMTVFGLAIYMLNGPILALYSDDPKLVGFALPLVAFSAWVLMFDGGQVVLSSALRGLGETWAPMWIQSFAYLTVMIPLSYALALPMGRGVQGLLEAIIIASIVSVVLQSIRFGRHAARLKL